MDHSHKNYGFMIPESFLTQLEEYTRGYMLVVCNDKGELFAYEAYDNPVIKLGVINFAEMHSSAALRHMHNMALREEEEMEDMGEPEDMEEEEENDDYGDGQL